MNAGLGTVLAILGLVCWGAVYWLWRRPITDPLILRVCYLFAVVALYGLGYFCILAGLGIDHWDDSSAWYWDTWLLIFSTGAVSGAFAWSKFRGVMRILMISLPVIGAIQVVRFYLTA